MTTPREALELSKDGFLSGLGDTQVTAILTALAPFLRTPGTVEVCVHHDDGACINPLRQTTNDCHHLQCPLKSTK